VEPVKISHEFGSSAPWPIFLYNAIQLPFSPNHWGFPAAHEGDNEFIKLF
jgi:hypothetical protein